MQFNVMPRSFEKIQQSPIFWVLLIYSIISVVTLTHHDFWGDEVHTFNAVQLDTAQLLQTRANAGHPPLFFLLQRGIGAIAGINEFSLRLLPCLASILTCVLVHRWLRGCFSEPVAALATASFAFSPAQLLVSHMARAYAVLQLTLTALLFLARNDYQPSRYRLMAGFILSFVAVYLHGSAAIWLPVVCVSIFLVRPSQWRLIAACSLGALLYLPFWLAFQTRVNLASRTVTSQSWTWLDVAQLPARLWLGRLTTVVPISVTVMISIVMGATLVMNFRNDRKPYAKFHIVMLVLAMWISVVAALEARSFLRVERYYAPLFPLTAFVFACCYQWLSRLKPIPRMIGVALAIITCTATYAAYLYHPPFTRDSQIAEYLRMRRLADEPIVLLTDNSARELSFRFYNRPNQVQVINRQLPAKLPQFNKRLWVVVSPDSPQLRDELLAHNDLAGCAVSFRTFVQSALLEIEVQPR